jgi:hypothetical protein
VGGDPRRGCLRVFSLAARLDADDTIVDLATPLWAWTPAAAVLSLHLTKRCECSTGATDDMLSSMPVDTNIWWARHRFTSDGSQSGLGRGTVECICRYETLWTAPASAPSAPRFPTGCPL